MILNKDYTALFILLRAGLWNIKPEDISIFPLSNNSWWKILKISQVQTVTGIVFKGILNLPHEMHPNEDIIIKWIAEVNSIEKKNRMMNGVLATLFSYFSSNNIKCVLQKGQGVALMYIDPLLRECGDIDLYFPLNKDHKKAIELMKAEGCEIHHSSDGSYTYQWNGIEVEHHSNLIDIQNPFLRKDLSRIIAKYGFVETILDKEWNFYITTPANIINLILLNTHIMKHTFGYGIGLRQMCDMARAYHCSKELINQEELKSIYQKLGIEKWSLTLHSFLITYIGLSENDLPYPDKTIFPTDHLLNIILQGGNFGMYDEERSKFSQTKWKRKMNTLKVFYNRRRFSIDQAPKEAFCTFITLLMGQLK